MKWLLIVLLIAGTPVITAYSGTFLDDFSDGNLDGWHIQGHPPGTPVEVKNGYVVMDTTIGKNDNPINFRILFKIVSLELRTGNSENWNSYTLRCRVKFSKVPAPPTTSLFTISVRRNKGHFNVMAEQQMQIIWSGPLEAVAVATVPLDAKFNIEDGRIVGAVQHTFIRRGRLKPIELNRWIPIKIVAEANDFEFHFNDNLLIRYKDETAVPGTVRFQADAEMLVHLDDVAVTGPTVPDLDIGRPHSVYPRLHLTTTWGEIKNWL